MEDRLLGARIAQGRTYGPRMDASSKVRNNGNVAHRDRTEFKNTSTRRTRSAGAVIRKRQAAEDILKMDKLVSEAVGKLGIHHERTTGCR